MINLPPRGAPLNLDTVNWHYIGQYKENIEIIANRRHAQKKGFKSSLYLNSHSHLLGYQGEAIYAIETGQKTNKNLLVNGDIGYDFADGADIKTCKYWRDPWLKHPLNQEIKAKKLVLVAFDQELYRGCVVGWATPEEILNAPIYTWTEAAGPQRSLSHNQLHK